MVFVIMGSVCLGIVILLSILILCGLPLGELTMGGRYRVYPPKFKIVLALQLLLQIGFVVVLLMLGGIIPTFAHIIIKILGFVLAVYLTINSICNLISPSLKEKMIMTPLSVMAATAFWALAIAF